MKFVLSKTLSVFVLLAMFVPLRAFADGCSTGFQQAPFPAVLPAMGDDTCPTSANIAGGNQVIFQNFQNDKEALSEFKARYAELLRSSGWSIGDKPKMPMNVIDVDVITAEHTAGYRAVIVLMNVLQRRKAAAVNVTPKPDPVPAAKKTKTPMGPIGVSIKLIVHKKSYN